MPGLVAYKLVAYKKVYSVITQKVTIIAYLTASALEEAFQK